MAALIEFFDPELLSGHAAGVPDCRGNRVGSLLRTRRNRNARKWSSKEPVMKRFHVHVAVDNLEANVRFYSTVFGIPPTVEKPDYAKWMLEDPRINFAISKRGVRRRASITWDSRSTPTKELSALRRQVADAEIASARPAGCDLLLRTFRQVLDRATLEASRGRPFIPWIRYLCTVTRTGRRRALAALTAPNIESLPGKSGACCA